MNERIKELLKESTESRWYCGQKHDEVDQEKFAELLVRECVKVAHPKLTDVGEWAAGMRLVQKRLEQHFGVEEPVNDSKELHTCPYREEIHNDYESLCDCDEEQQHQCAMDI